MYTKQLLIASIASGLLFITGCSGTGEKQTADTAEPVSVVIARPGGNIQGGISISGEIEAARSANISTRVMGTIHRIYVKVGDRVRKGQLLATISSQDIQAKRAQAEAAIAEAQANVNNAKKDYDRFTILYSKQSATAKELDNVTLQYKAATSRLEAAQQMRNEVNAMLAYASLTAPFDGVVTQKQADEGSMASPGIPILTVEQAGQLQVSASVSEADIHKIKYGGKAMVEIKAIDKTIETTIAEISPSAVFSGGQYEIKLASPASQSRDLYAGMYVNVFIPVSSGQANAADSSPSTILVPAASLVHTDQLTGLYTLSSNNTALLRWVRTGKSYGDMTEILSGLSANESFIVKASGKLYNGVPVKVQNK
jgi:RND family efflux transporter MFP subunit